MVREIASVNETSKSVSVAALTAEIVSAYVSNNKIAPSDLAGLITTVAGQLSKVGAKPEQPAEEKPEPAVSVRRSIRPDHLVCLVCGKPQKMLKRHLAVRARADACPVPRALRAQARLSDGGARTTSSSGARLLSGPAWERRRSRRDAAEIDCAAEGA